MRNKLRVKGFTLIELMIVVAIIGILSSIAVPQYQSYIKKTQMGTALASISALKINVEDHIANNGSFPTIASDDMNSKLGATATSMGTMETKQDTTDTTGGQIILSFAGDSLFDGNKIALQRDNTGLWTCVTDIAQATFFPKQCKNGTLL